MNAPHWTLPVLRGSRCTLRTLTLDDAQSLSRHGDDEAVWRNLFDGFPRPYTVEVAQQWCAGGWQEFGLSWAIEVDGEAVGCFSLRRDPEWMRCNAELGYWLGQACWGRGIASEALGLVRDWAWASFPELTRLYMRIFAWNAASLKVAQHAGFHQEAYLPHSAFKNGEVVDLLQWGLYRPSGVDVAKMKP